MTCVGILVPLVSELATLSPLRLKQAHIHRMNTSTLVCLAGMGQEASSRATMALLDAGATHLLNWGCCGALDKALKPGTLSLPPSVIYQDAKYKSDPAWHTRLHMTLQSTLHTDAQGLLFSSTTVLPDGSSKLATREVTGAVAVDMESGAMAHIASANNIPFAVLRGVADGVGHTIPATVSAALGPTGQINGLKLMAGILGAPRDLPALLQLGYRFSLAARSLKKAADLLENADWCHRPSDQIRHSPTVTGQP